MLYYTNSPIVYDPTSPSTLYPHYPFPVSDFCNFGKGTGYASSGQDKVTMLGMQSLRTLAF